MRKLVIVLIGLMALFTLFRAVSVFADKKAEDTQTQQEFASL